MCKAKRNMILFISLLIAAGCSLAEKSALSDSQFVYLYVDLSFAAESFLSDSVKLAQVQDSIFSAHKVTRQQFDDYKNNLDKSPERWSVIWQMVVDELNKREEAIRKEQEKNKPKKSPAKNEQKSDKNK